MNQPADVRHTTSKAFDTTCRIANDPRLAICATFGNLETDQGTWPVRFPHDDKIKHTECVLLKLCTCKQKLTDNLVQYIFPSHLNSKL